jgi:hypothetical protein
MARFALSPASKQNRRPSKLVGFEHHHQFERGYALARSRHIERNTCYARCLCLSFSFTSTVRIFSQFYSCSSEVSGFSGRVERVDCFVPVRPMHRVLRGTFDGTRLDTGAPKLSIHLGGVSLWFEPGLKSGSISGGDVDGVVFETEGIEIWGVSK